jgi:hypothetical protein
MDTTSPHDTQPGLFPTAGTGTSSPSTPEDSPWADPPFVVQSVKPAPAVSKLSPLPSTSKAPSPPTRSFVDRPPHPLLKSNASFPPLPISSLATRIRNAALTTVGADPR